MIIGFPNGVSSADTFDTAEKIEGWFYASDALTVGTAAMLDFAAGTNAGKRVLQATAANDHDIVGLYEGKGFPTGTTVAITGLTGRAAVAADVVRITMYGPGVARLSDILLATAGNIATVTTGGVLHAIAAIATAAGCGNQGFVLVGTATDAVVTATATATTSATCRVWSRLL